MCQILDLLYATTALSTPKRSRKLVNMSPYKLVAMRVLKHLLGDDPDAGA